MTRHLEPDELVEIADGSRPRDTAPHLEECSRCRATLADLEAALSAAVSDEVPEPSPLFWGHLSERISAAVGREHIADERWWMSPRIGTAAGEGVLDREGAAQTQHVGRGIAPLDAVETVARGAGELNETGHVCLLVCGHCAP